MRSAQTVQLAMHAGSDSSYAGSLFSFFATGFGLRNNDHRCQQLAVNRNQTKTAQLRELPKFRPFFVAFFLLVGGGLRPRALCDWSSVLVVCPDRFLVVTCSKEDKKKKKPN